MDNNRYIGFKSDVVIAQWLMYIYIRVGCMVQFSSFFTFHFLRCPATFFDIFLQPDMNEMSRSVLSLLFHTFVYGGGDIRTS